MTVDEQLEAVVRAGLFRDREEAIAQAVRTLFTVRPQLRTEAALDLFRRGEVSFLRASELCGLDAESFRLLLKDRGIPWEVEAASSQEMDQASEDFFSRPKS